MKDRIDKFIHSKTCLIIASCLCSIVAFLFVLNLNNPMAEQSFEIPVTVINQENMEENELLVSADDIPEKISVTVSGRQSLLQVISSSDFECTVDLSDVSESGEKKISISKPTCSKLGVKIKKYSPTSINCTFDKKNVTTLNVVVDYSSDLLKSGYEFISVYPDTESIQVSGLESELENLGYISINLNSIIEKDSIDCSKSASYIGSFITKDGEDVTSKFDPVSIIVKMEVGKRVPLVYSVTGKPADGFYLNSNSMSNNKVLIQGYASETKKIQSISIGTVQLDGESESFNKEYDVATLLPEGVTVYGNSKVTVNIEILEYEKNAIEYDISEISMAGLNENLYSYYFEERTITVYIKGTQEALDAFKKSSLEPTLDLEEKSAGNYIVPIKFTNLQEDIYIVGDYTINVTITDLSEEILQQ